MSELQEEKKELKLENITLNEQLNNEKEINRQLNEKIKELEENLNNEIELQLRKELANVTADRNYLETVLQDNAVIELFDPATRAYTPDVRQCIMDLTSYNVASDNVGPVIESILKLCNKSPNAIPTRKTVDNIISEKIAIGQRQIGATFSNLTNTCLYGDETRKFGKTYQTFLLSDENKNVYFLGLRDMCDKSASTTLQCFTNILDDISDICESYRNNNITSHGHNILCNIRDLCRTEHKLI